MDKVLSTEEEPEKVKLSQSESKVVDKVAQLNFSSKSNDAPFSLVNVPKINNTVVNNNNNSKINGSKLTNEANVSKAIYKNKINENKLQLAKQEISKVIQQSAPVTNTVVTDNSSQVSFNPSEDLRISNDDSSLYRRF